MAGFDDLLEWFSSEGSDEVIEHEGLDVESLCVFDMFEEPASTPSSSAYAPSLCFSTATTTPSTTLSQLPRSEEHTSELQSLMRISYAVFCLKKKKKTKNTSQPQ